FQVRMPSGLKLASFATGLVVLVCLVGGLIWYGAGRDQRGDASEFNASATPGAAVAVKGGQVLWATFGRNAAHDRFADKTGIEPPFAAPAWSWEAEGRL